MAEGDTIHRLADRMRIALEGEEIAVAAAPAPRSPLRLAGERLKRLEGARVDSVDARGKHLLVGFSCGLTLHSHLGMKGSWRLAREPSGLGRPERSAWLVLSTQRACAGQFGGPALSLLTPGELRRERRLSRLGPDLLAPGFDPAAGAARLGSHPGRPLGEAILDQRLVAGVGNVLKSEGLFVRGLDPFAPVSAFSTDELTELLETERELMERSVASGRRERRVYGLAGRPCPRCGTALRSAPQGDANRITHWCPSCQPRRQPPNSVNVRE